MKCVACGCDVDRIIELAGQSIYICDSCGFVQRKGGSSEVFCETPEEYKELYFGDDYENKRNR